MSAAPHLMDDVARLQRTYEGAATPTLLRGLLEREFTGGTLAFVSSFGTESAVLLHMVAAIDPRTPVLLVDTLKLFPETYAYTALLTEHLGLENVTHVRPAISDLKTHDPDSDLWQRNPNACCHIRKVLPLQRALQPFRAWSTGRKRLHGGGRKTLALFEEDGSHIKVNPLAGWSADALDAYFGLHRLPPHPLLKAGFTSLGCVPCTSLPEQGADPRSGRWQGQEKTECGIHANTDYQI